MTETTFAATDLGILPGGAESVALSINDSGQIVGFANVTGGLNHAFLYQNGTMYDLNALTNLPGGWTLNEAYSISENGLIACFGNDGSNNYVAVELTPVPVVVNLGSLTPSGFVNPLGINNSGTIVGSAATSSGDHAFSYSAGVIADLGTLGGNQSAAYAINSSGIIVGYSDLGGGPIPAFSYSGGTMTSIGTLGGDDATATAINSSGVIVGFSDTTGGAARHAFSYGSGAMTDLGTLGGPDSQANGINSSGTIVGDADLANEGGDHAFSYSNGIMTDLGTLGASDSFAYGINDSGTIVGVSSTSSFQDHAFSYSGGTMTDLGTLGGVGSQANAINSSGVIVGQSNDSSEANVAFVYNNGQMTDLNTLVSLPGVTLTSANAINDIGQIVATGSDNNGYLVNYGTGLTPVPTPTPTPSPTPSPTPTPSPSPTPTHTPTPTLSPSSTPTPTHMPTPTSAPTPSPSSSPTLVPSPTSTPAPTPPALSAPVVITTGNAETFSGTPVTVDSGIVVTDSSATIANGTATITNFVAGEDVLGLTTSGSTGGITANFDTTNGVLTLTSVGSSTVAEWQAALRLVTYSNTSATPNPANRSITFVVSDGTNSSAAATPDTIIISGATPTPIAYGPLAGFLIDVPESPTAGVPFTVTVEAVDANNNVVGNYNENAGFAQETWDLLTEAGDYGFLGSITFSNGVATPQLTIYSPAPSNFLGQTGYFVVVQSGSILQLSATFDVVELAASPTPAPSPTTPGPAAYFTVVAPSVFYEDTLTTVTVNAFDSNGNLATSFSGNVSILLGDTVFITPPGADYYNSPITLTNGTGTTQIAFYAPTSAPYEYETVHAFNADSTVTGVSGFITVWPGLPPPTPTPTPAPVASITQQPSSADVIEGQPVTFSVIVSSNPQLGINLEWQMSTDGGVTWPNVSSWPEASVTNPTNMGSTLTISATSRAMSGYQFRLFAYSPVPLPMPNVTSVPATLTVAALPFGDSIVYDFSTLAGAPGQKGSADGKGITARFSAPHGIAVDGVGNVYVADTGNSTIREIALDGTVTTIAGSAGTTGAVDGQGTAALFNHPQGIAMDYLGNISVADTGNFDLRAISPSGAVSTIYGTPGVSGYGNTGGPGPGYPAYFEAPVSVAVDPLNLYSAKMVSDANAIRYTFEDYLETAAGRELQAGSFADGITYDPYDYPDSPYAEFSGPQGVAESGNVVYVADTGNKAIREMSVFDNEGGDTELWNVSTVLGGPSAQSPLKNPSGVAVDMQGNVYITDTALQEILELSVSGSLTVLGGTGHAGAADGLGRLAEFSGPYGIAIDSENNIYIADTNNNTIRKGVPRVQSKPPAIQTQPVSQTVASNSSATFSVVAEGTLLGYQWTFNGVSISGATASSYTISNATVANSGSYAVVVSSASGSLTSQSALLAVNPPIGVLTLAEQPASYTITFGSTVILSVGVGPGAGTTSTGSPRTATSANAYTYQWYLDGTVLVDGGAISGSQSASLFLGAGSANPGTYNCLVSDSSGSVFSQDANISVQSSPNQGRLIDVSCRGQVGPGNGNLIVGFVVGGGGATLPENVLLRASGPALAPFGILGFLPDPMINLYSTSSGSSLLKSNSGWSGSGSISSTSALVGAFAWTNPSSADAALYDHLTPGPYTAAVSGVSGDSGVALAEVYDATPIDTYTATSPRLINISARAKAGTGANGLIAGFVIGGSTARTVLVRASGPALAGFGLTGLLPDPQLQLFISNNDGTSTLLQSNTGWGGSPQIASVAAVVGAFGWGDSATSDSAILVTLQPGAYTAQVLGASGDTGIALVEVYEVP